MRAGSGRSAGRRDVDTAHQVVAAERARPPKLAIARKSRAGQRILLRLACGGLREEVAGWRDDCRLPGLGLPCWSARLGLPGRYARRVLPSGRNRSGLPGRCTWHGPRRRMGRSAQADATCGRRIREALDGCDRGIGGRTRRLLERPLRPIRSRAASLPGRASLRGRSGYRERLAGGARLWLARLGLGWLCLPARQVLTRQCLTSLGLAR